MRDRGHEEQHSKSAWGPCTVKLAPWSIRCIWRMWDDCIQRFLSTLSQWKGDAGREGERDQAATGVCNNLHLNLVFLLYYHWLFYISHCTFSVWVKMWADSDDQVARQHWLCEATYTGIWVLFWLGFNLLLSTSFLLVVILSLIFLILCFSFLLLFLSFTPFLFTPFCLYDCTVEIPAPGRCAVPLASRSSSSREHLSKLCSVMTTQQWGNWADPEAKAVRGDWWEGQRGQAILVPPT